MIFLGTILQPRHLVPALCAVLTTTGNLLAAPLESIRVNETGDGFKLDNSRNPFRIWGVNYDHDTKGENGRLLEDYWIEEWTTVEEDFREIRLLGANVIRVHLQFGRFMQSPNEPRSESLSQLRKLIDLAETEELYLNLTGLGCYHKQDVPDWYNSLSETDRWKAQAKFWGAIAQTCRGRSAVFCYDLMNEPVVAGEEAGGWLAGELAGKYFVQRLTLWKGDRDPTDIAESWVKQMVEAIRSEDPDTLVTVGVIPWAMTWPSAKPLFYSPQVARYLDFVSVHFYPESGEVEQALTALKVYEIGKPLVIEEMFPLKCSLEEMDEFLSGSDEIADGWFSFYWGKTQEEYEAERKESMVNALMADWLEYFGKGPPRK